MQSGRSWFEEVASIVDALPERFTLADVYAFEPELQEIHPDNNSIQDTMRRVLQELRDAGYLRFLERGVYQKPSSDAEVPLPTSATATPKSSLKKWDVDSVPLEKRSIMAYVVSPRESAIAVAREFLLVEDFETFLHASGHATTRKKIPIENGYLWTDIFDVTTSTLYEAKSESSRSNIRMLIGQLMDYARYVHPETTSALLPSKPAPDLVELLREAKIDCTYRDEDGSFHTLPA